MVDKIKVMIVDESAVVRQFVTQALVSDPGIEVIAATSDPILALEKMRLIWPDVLIIDIETPRMDGITFLKKIMAEHPTPVVVCSSLAEQGTQATFKALAAGAVAIITKPKFGLKSFLEDASGDIVQAVLSAAKANVRTLGMTSNRPKLSADAVLSANYTPALKRTTDQVIAIGTSTGGTHALEAVLTRLPATSLGIVIVQHMPAVFTAMFAERLHTLSQIEVREAQNGDQVIPGRALIAPGGKHMMLRRNGTQYIVDVIDGPLVNRHKPSVDVLFRSVAKFAGANALGIIMTGMGDDGARGLKEMHDAGARTIAQDEASCVVFGMPKEAIKLGAVDLTLPLDQIPAAIVSHGANLTKEVQ
ncbi:chemotaxis response regulator protein-glutamate methylesterase [Propionivibrio sp.]|uniref:protein-glutamate methylesterase/protein-glutamine glutaminase n=1 Tax=Propionivibrio sp. TaxID=2212460 RepID=UPI00262D531F|nr:chemotaxis response regulator protein-glutamate methylesterase [Propionivibrio sp.]